MIVYRPGTQEWIHAIKMDQIVERKGTRSNGNPTVFQVFIIFKLGFKADIRYTDLTDTSVERIFIDFAASKLLIHLHHDRVVDKKTVPFDLRAV